MSSNVRDLIPTNTTRLGDLGYPSRPDTMTVLGAQWRRNNWIGSAIQYGEFVSAMTRDREEGFDAFRDASQMVRDRFPGTLKNIHNRNDLRLLERRIGQEQADQRILQRGTLLQNLGTGLLVGGLDPLNYIPAFKAVQGIRGAQKALGVAKATAATAFVTESASEVALQSLQVDRSAEESLSNIAFTSILAGGLGGTLGAISARRGKQIRTEIEDMMDPRKASGLSADDAIQIPDAGGLGKEGANGYDGPTPAQVTLADSFASGPLVAAIRSNPGTEIMVKSWSRSMRFFTQHFAETSVRTKANQQGVHSPIPAEAEIRQFDNMRDMSLRELRQAFLDMRDRIAGKTPARGGEGVTGLRVGAKRLDDRLSQVLGRRDKNVPTWKDFKREVGYAHHMGDKVVETRPRFAQEAAPEIERASRFIRDNYTGQFTKMLIDLKIIPKTFTPKGAISYMARVWNRDMVENGLSDGKNFLQVAEEWVRVSERNINRKVPLTEQEVRIAAQEIQEHILGNVEGRIDYSAMSGKGSRFTKNRRLDMPIEMIADFLELDIDVVTRMYHRTVPPDIVLRQRYGSTDVNKMKNPETGKLIVDDIRADYDRAMQGQNEKVRAKLRRRMTRDLDQLDTMVKLMRNRLVGGMDPTSGMNRGLRALRQMSLLSQGGFFLIASIPDVGSIILRNGLKTVYKQSTGRYLKNMTLRMDADVIRDLQRFGVGNEMIENTVWSSLTDITHNYGQSSRFLRALDSATDMFSFVNLHTPWNAYMKKMAGEGVMMNMMRWTKLDIDGSLKGADRSMLRQFGVSKKRSRVIQEQLQQHGKRGKDGDFITANVKEWGEGLDGKALEDAKDAAFAFSTSIRRQSDIAVVTPGVLDKPTIMLSNSVAQTIFQYRSFSIASVQRVMIPSLQRLHEQPIAVMNGLASMVAFGAMGYAIRLKLQGKELPDFDDIDRWLFEGAKRSGAAELFFMPLSYGQGAGLIPTGIEDGPHFSRYGLDETIGGPSYGYLKSGVQVGQGLVDEAYRFAGFGDSRFTQGKVKAARRVAPFNQIFWWNNLTNLVEEEIAADFPRERRRRSRRRRRR